MIGDEKLTAIYNMTSLTMVMISSYCCSLHYSSFFFPFINPLLTVPIFSGFPIPRSPPPLHLPRRFSLLILVFALCSSSCTVFFVMRRRHRPRLLPAATTTSGDYDYDQRRTLRPAASTTAVLRVSHRLQLRFTIYAGNRVCFNDERLFV